MNIYELMEQLYTKYAYLSAGGDDNQAWPFTPIRELYEAYYAFCPPIEDWPDGAQWYTIDADGIPIWHRRLPESDIVTCGWISGTGRKAFPREPRPLRIGIDWRLCKWPRPEVSDD